MTDATTDAALRYYASAGAALFPIPAGSKAPGGIVESFAQDWSANPAQWTAWAQQNPGCNFGIVAGPSRLIIVDVDVSEVGRDRAWALWCDWCAKAGIAVPTPHVQSARGGWHFYFRVPDDAPPLRQVALIRPVDAGTKKAVIDLRVGNGFTVAAGSYYDGTAKGEESGPYVLLSDAPPYAAPAALIEYATRAESSERITRPGDRDRNDVAALVTWLGERESFTGYEDWLSIGMALKLEFGDDGLELWQLAHDDTVTPEVERSKWESFASDPTGDSVTLSTWLDRAHKAGWRGSVRRSAASMFGEAGQVAALAAAAGASLPDPIGAVPMLAGQEVLTRLGKPILTEFLSSTADAPFRPSSPDYPQLPDACSGHGLFVDLKSAVERVLAMAENPKTFRAARVNEVLGLLSIVHGDTFDAVRRRITTLGCHLPMRSIKLFAAALAEKVEREFVEQDDWVYSVKGEIEHDNSDNVVVGLGILGIEIRWNAWLERAELRGGADVDIRWPEWTYIDDAVVAKLRTRWNRTKTRFRPGKDFLWESLLAIAHLNYVDPARDYLDAMAAAWDGTPRLSVWLSAACGVPCDPYHQAVGRNIIGGIVRRIRRPGCKHDTMAVFFGPQGTGKSTMARILAGQDDWFTDTVMLGDKSTELVLSLAGKSVVEIGEMGMRGAANPNHVKAMISRQVDAGRTAYARAVSERHRRNIFIGTTNDDEPLVDPTGNRRFLPVKVASEIRLDWLVENLPQLIGEAAAIEDRGETFALPRELWGIAAEHQDAARAESDVETRLADWFAPTALSGPLTYITASDLVELTQAAGWRSGGPNTARGAIMKQMGFRVDLVTVDGKRVRAWIRGDYDRPSDVVQTGTRYTVGADNGGRPRVVLRRADGEAGQAAPPMPPMRGA